MFLVFLSVHRGPPRQGSRGAPHVKVWGRGAPPQSRSRSRSGGPPRSRSRSGGPPGQGQGAPQVKVRGAPMSRSEGPPVNVQVKVRGPRSMSRSRSGGPPWSRSKNAESAGGTPLAVTQEDCLVSVNVKAWVSRLPGIQSPFWFEILYYLMNCKFWYLRLG